MIPNSKNPLKPDTGNAQELRELISHFQVGWWAGVPLSDHEYSGALLRVVPGKGKLTGYAMTPKHLVEGGAGQEVMEVYVVKDKAENYHQQVRTPLRFFCSFTLGIE